MSERRSAILTIILIWLAWAIIVIAFQYIVDARIDLTRPDRSFSWTADATWANSNSPYLRDPFLNAQVAWDSEFYLSIAETGYDDPAVRTVRTDKGQRLSLNYAFYPLYPYMMRVIGVPLGILGLSEIATLTLAGVLISLAGTLAAMIALYVLTHDTLGKSGGIRTAFYLLVFPTSFFLVQVYTEGLFVGLAFSSLALMRRKQWLWAALLAALATWTRAVGVMLIVPYGVALLRQINWPKTRENVRHVLLNRQLILAGLIGLLPVTAYLSWRMVLGQQFNEVEEAFFSRGVLAIRESWNAWKDALTLADGNKQSIIYYLLELGVLTVAFVSCLFTLRRYPEIAIFGLGVSFISVTSGVPQSMARYMLVVPSIFIFSGQMGKNMVFHNTWMLIGTLLLSLLMIIFTFNFWAG